MLEQGQIIKNLIPTESVIINKVQELGSMYSITYTGVNTSKVNTKVIDENTFNNLEILSKWIF